MGTKLIETHGKSIKFIGSDGKESQINLSSSTDPKFKNTLFLEFSRPVEKEDLTPKGKARRTARSFLSEDKKKINTLLTISKKAGLSLFVILEDCLLEKGLLRKVGSKNNLTSHTRGLCNKPDPKQPTHCKCCGTQMNNGKCIVCPSSKN